MTRKELITSRGEEHLHKPWFAKVSRSRLAREVRGGPRSLVLLNAVSFGTLFLTCSYGLNAWSESPKKSRWSSVDLNDLNTKFENYHRIKDLRIFQATDICILNNEDGLFIRPPLNGYAADQAKKRLVNTPLSPEHNLSSIDRRTEIRYFDDPTYVVNCWRRWDTDTNPAHWIMKLGVLFSLSLQSLNYTHYYNERGLRMNQIKHIFFHQCANPFAKQWEWGQYLWGIISSYLPPVALTWASEALPERTNMPQKSILYCFKSCFFDHNYGIWIQRANIKEWQEISRPFYSDAQKNLPEKCCRIGIFQRTTGQSLRTFNNLDDLRLMTQTYSSYPIEIVSISESDPISTQIMAFNSFHILMSPHGSHLANLLFTVHRITVIEIVSCAADEVFQQNGELLGIDYILSTGHKTGANCPEAANKSFLEAASSHHSTDILRCKLSTKNCDVHVNLSIIEGILQSKISKSK